jgi:hypothetical protein
MTSFYGSGAGKVIVSAGAVGDYNSIENAPIKNLEGTAESPIILNQVADGVYVLKGNYKLSDSDEDLKNELFNKSVTVETDVTTGNKVVTYSYVSDGEA